jgi:hypothetical protein
LTGLEGEYQDGNPTFSFLGGDSKGVEPLGTSCILGDEEKDGRRHFIVFLNFQAVAVEYFSVGIGSSGKNQNWEIISIGLNAENTNYEAQNRIKN